MIHRPLNITRVAFRIFMVAILLGTIRGEGGGRPQDQDLSQLVPEMEPWILTEEPQRFRPDTLFEYIDGAAESYLIYDFQELLVAQFGKPGTDAAVTLEAYDMGSDVDAFGIYSTERSSESPPVNVGTQGYREGEALNFIAGKYYVKLLGFNAGEETENILEEFARKTADEVKNKSALPRVLSLFPKEGLIANSEKYIRRNVMGFDFLSRGAFASYSLNGANFECFLIEAGPDEAPSVLAERFLDFHKRDGASIAVIPRGRRLRTRYRQTIEIGVSGNFLCGVIGLTDESETTAGDYLDRLTASAEAFGRNRHP